MKIVGLILILATISACGIKGPPLPPLREETIQTQKSSSTASSQDNTKANQKMQK